jgi:hypothetical protein
MLLPSLLPSLLASLLLLFQLLLRLPKLSSLLHFDDNGADDGEGAADANRGAHKYDRIMKNPVVVLPLLTNQNNQSIPQQTHWPHS